MAVLWIQRFGRKTALQHSVPTIVMICRFQQKLAKVQGLKPNVGGCHWEVRESAEDGFK